MQPRCVECDKEIPGAHVGRKYCSRLCKGRWQRKHGGKNVKGHTCRVCRIVFPIKRGQHNKWICSAKCRRAQAAKCIREFHLRQPQAEAVYRARTRAKIGPDGNLKRFRRTNPHAPRACESCGENRVLDIAHKPGFERFGEHRSSRNCKWPDMVWILCPTCHALIDRMNYPPEELGLLSIADLL